MLSASAAPRTYELYESAGNAHDDATRTINETTDIDTLNRQARELRKDLSAGHPMASALDEAIANRRKAIAEETEWSKFSARERELMVSAHEPTINVPESYTEPEPDEIHLAIMREVTALGGQMLSGRTAEIGVPPFDSAMPFRLDLVKVDKESCEPMADGKTYTCSYRHQLELSVPAKTLATLHLGGSPPAMFNNMLAQILGKVNKARPRVTTHTFLLTDRGWRSPSMRGQNVQAMLDTYAELGSGFPECNLVNLDGRLRCE